ncbi:hypothetical protein [Actinomadura sp. 9N215]|uniref:hypothetical protein n=1 Tax=Actinomadura sp. 9N215 TaxID=3375150 RepID=UPI0037A98F3D
MKFEPVDVPEADLQPEPSSVPPHIDEPPATDEPADLETLVAELWARFKATADQMIDDISELNAFVAAYETARGRDEPLSGTPPADFRPSRFGGPAPGRPVKGMVDGT